MGPHLVGLLQAEQALLLEPQLAHQPRCTAMDFHNAPVVDVQLPDNQVVD
jgi:hypothetical protein